MSVVDTNVLVHISVKTSPDHLLARAALARLVASGSVAVTRQILREYLAATTRPQTWATAATVPVAMQSVDGFMRRFEVLEDGPQVWDQLLALGDRFSFGGKQVHDANIVATMLAHGETRLLTFNVADFRRFSSVIEVVTP